jgi:hypothetical protein
MTDFHHLLVECTVILLQISKVSRVVDNFHDVTNLEAPSLSEERTIPKGHKYLHAKNSFPASTVSK